MNSGATVEFAPTRLVPVRIKDLPGTGSHRFATARATGGATSGRGRAQDDAGVSGVPRIRTCTARAPGINQLTLSLPCELRGSPRCVFSRARSRFHGLGVWRAGSLCCRVRAVLVRICFIKVCILGR